MVTMIIRAGRANQRVALALQTLTHQGYRLFAMSLASQIHPSRHQKTEELIVHHKIVK
jgi:hypothetical protein